MGFHHLLLYAIPLFLVSMWIEYKLNDDRDSTSYTHKDFVANMSIGLGAILFGLIASSFSISIYLASLNYFAPWRIRFLGYENIGWGLGAWAICMLADDFTYYWFHRTSHRIRLLWACHIVHHNSDHYNFSTSVRNGWFAILYKPVYWCWMAALGFHPLMILSCLALNSFYQFFCHTEHLPGWDRLAVILNTPGLHAIHHGKDDHCIDKNYGGVLILFDRLFGTYQPIDPSRKISYGVTHPPRSAHFIEVTIHEFRDMFRCIKKHNSWMVRLKVLIYPPGWNPEDDQY